MRRLLASLVLMSPWMMLIPIAMSAQEQSAAQEAPTEALAPSAPSAPLADGFDMPVGAPDGEGYYNAQGFGTNSHLGEDWNGLGGGSSDYGDPVYAIGVGRVSFVGDLPGGWGQVVRIVHRYEEGGEVHAVESLYAHLSESSVRVDDVVARGQRIGAIGDADGAYVAHLHLELRSRVGMSIGPGYSQNTRGYLSPSAFISAHR